MKTEIKFKALMSFVLLVALSGASCVVAGEPEDEIEALTRQYFATWSAADMEEYGKLFHPSSTIYSLDSRNRPQGQYLQQFLHGQTKAHQRALSPMREMPTRISIQSNDRLARAEVDWELIKGSERIRGIDYFTWIRTPEGWRILTLVFYESSRERNPSHGLR